MPLEKAVTLDRETVTSHDTEAELHMPADNVAAQRRR